MGLNPNSPPLEETKFSMFGREIVAAEVKMESTWFCVGFSDSMTI